jgi:hypothetical protein
MQELEACADAVNATIDATINATRMESLRLALKTQTDAAATSNQFAKV